MKRNKSRHPEQEGKRCKCGAPWEFEQNTLFEYEENEYYCAPCYKELCKEAAIEVVTVEEPAAAKTSHYEQVTF